MKKIITPLFIMVLFFILVTSVSATWCDNDYIKRINVSVNNTGGSALTDYQIYVNLSDNPINETSLRVYNATSCTLRPHWTENETGGNSYGVWINYSSIAASTWTNNTAIYYDNSLVGSTNNGLSTFTFFEDAFESINPLTEVFIDQHDVTYPRVFIPRIAKMPNGKLLAVYIKGTSDNDLYMQIWGAFSDNNGTSWGTPFQIEAGNPGVWGALDPCLLVVNDTTILLHYTRQIGSGYLECKIYQKTSTDNGTTWGSDTYIDTGYVYNNHPNNGIKMQDGTLIWSFGRRLPPSWLFRAATMKSTDGGDSWTIGNLAPASGAGTHGDNEPTVVELSNNSLYMLMRTNEGHLWQTVSTNKGSTWNTPTASFVSPYAPATLYRLSWNPNKILVVWDDSSSNRYPLKIAISTDDCASWTNEKIIKSPGYNVAYPDIAETSDGRIIVGWWDRPSSVDDVKCTVFDEAWLHDKELWDITGTPTQSNGILQCQGDESVKSKSTFSTNLAFRSRCKSKHFDDISYIETIEFQDGGYVGAFSCWNAVENKGNYVTYNSAYERSGITGWGADTYLISDQIRNGTSSVIFKVNGANTITHSTQVYSGSRSIRLMSGGPGAEIEVDWVLVRKYASPDPTSALGSEEQQGANPTLHIDNTINIQEDWGRNFNSNFSANVTVANASGVWMNFTNAEFTNTSLGDLNLSLDEWVNESHNVNAPVTNVSVDVHLKSTTAGATNDTDSFYYEITKRTNTATMDSPSVQNVDISETFYVNATCNEEYSDTFLGAANLLEDGAIIDTDTSVTNYVNFSHNEGSAGQYNYTVRFYNLTHYDNATTPTHSNVTVSEGEYTPGTPINLLNSTGNFWINHTWTEAIGWPNETDSYNVSIGGVWYNTTIITYYNNTGLSAHDWSNITVWAFNTSGSGTLSIGSVSQNTQIPNNVPVLSGLPDDTTDEDVNQTDIFDLDDYFSDVDGDTPTYLVESNNQSAYVSVTINASNNVSYTLASGWNGTASVVINVTDGWSGEDSDTFLIIVNAAPLPGDYIPGDPTTLQNTTGNYWINYTWTVGGGNTTDSYNVSWNLTWYNTTTDTFMKKEVGASNWGNITVYAFNSSGNGSHSAGYISDEVQAPSALPGDYPPATPTTLANTTGNGWVHYTWNSGGGANVTDSYNVSWNLTWYNNTLVAYMNDTVGEFGWANISVWAYNVSGNGSLSAGSISDETQAGGDTFTTSMGTTAYNLITYYGSTTSTAEQFGIDIGGVDYIAMYNGSFYTHTMGFAANNFTTYHGIGYYVYLNASGSSTYQRSNIPDTPYNTQLFNRWNTIGWTNSTNTNAEGVATSIGSACKYTSTLNADGVTYTTHTVGFTSNNHAVVKGEGYWVWTNTGLSWSRNS